MSSLPLTSLTVMVTRPPPAGLQLCKEIEAQGARAVHFPTIAFGPSDTKRFEAAVAQLGDQDWLIFISPQAVYSSVPAIRRAWPHFPPQVKLAAVGAGTAHALREAGYQVSAFPNAEWSSEGLLALPEFQTVTGQKIAIVRGEGGREELDNQLTAQGAIMLHVIAYQRLLPVVDVKIYQSLLKERVIDAIICGSFESVKNLKILMGKEGWSDLKVVPLIVVSERVKVLANDLGFQTIWVAQNASHAAVVETLMLKRNELCQSKTNIK